MMCMCETNTPEMKEHVLGAFKEWRRASPESTDFKADFDHQWFIVDTVTGDEWAVVDSGGGHSICGFDFEQVVYGDEN
jgi:hypothetical protein